MRSKLSQQQLDEYLKGKPFKVGDYVVLNYMDNSEVLMKTCSITQVHVIVQVDTNIANLKYDYTNKPEPYHLMSLSCCSEFNRVSRHKSQPWERTDGAERHIHLTPEAQERVIDDYVQTYVKEYIANRAPK